MENEIERALKDIDKIGLWVTDHQVEEELSKLKTKKEITNALKTQINIYQKVHNIAKEKDIYCFS